MSDNSQTLQMNMTDCLRALVTYFMGSQPSAIAPGAGLQANAGTNFGLDTIATSTAASTVLLAARAARVRATVKNNDSANPIFVSTTTATVSSFPIKAGESFTFTTEQALNMIDNGSHASVSVWEEWN